MAKRRVIISERDNIAALFEGDQALEFIIHRGDILLGDVYLAEVENILPSIDAAFVNVGGDKMGFLHSSDVQGKGELRSRLKPKQKLVVQVMKEPTGHKGPRVTTNISLPGRFLVLMPESRGISISRKIESAADRNRLKSIVSLIKPSGVGIIIRTEADGVSEADIQEDFEVLIERWQNIVSMADSADPPALLYRDQDLLYRVVRETVNEDVNELVVDTSFGFQRAQQLLQNWNLDKAIKVTQYTGQQSIMVGQGVEREIRQALMTKVPLPSGGYLYIQPTEALTVVDVNSGRFTSLQSQSDTIRITNLEATKEVARQLRLRNIGGMIVVDFIDMESRADQLAILQAFEAALADDKAKPQVGQLTDLGLVEMTRHRQGQALSEIFSKHCVHCSGTGNMLDAFQWSSSNAPEGESKGFDFRSRRHNTPPRNNKQRNEGRDGNRDREGRDGNRDNRERGGRQGDRDGNRDNARSESETSSREAMAPLAEATPSEPRGQNERSQERRGFDRGNRNAQDRAPQERSAPQDYPRANPADPALGKTSATGGAHINPSVPALIWPRPVAATASASGVRTDDDLPPVLQIYQEQLLDRFGIALGRFLKMAWLPQQANQQLSRMNPKATDIMTLVASIEGGDASSATASVEESPSEGEAEESTGDSASIDPAAPSETAVSNERPVVFEDTAELVQSPLSQALGLLPATLAQYAQVAFSEESPVEDTEAGEEEEPAAEADAEIKASRTAAGRRRRPSARKHRPPVSAVVSEAADSAS